MGSNSDNVLLMTGLDDEGPVGRRRTDVVGLRRGAAHDGTLAAEALERLDRYLAARGEIALDTYGIYLYTLARNGRMAEARAFMDRAGFQSIPSAVVAPFLSWFVDRFELDEPQASLTTQAALRD